MVGRITTTTTKELLLFSFKNAERKHEKFRKEKPKIL
jgi:hypothetical protein